MEVLEACVRFDALSPPVFRNLHPTLEVIPGFSTHLSLSSSGQEIPCGLSAQQ